MDKMKEKRYDRLSGCTISPECHLQVNGENADTAQLLDNAWNESEFENAFSLDQFDEMLQNATRPVPGSGAESEGD